MRSNHMGALPPNLFAFLTFLLTLVYSPVFVVQAENFTGLFEELNGFALWQYKTAIRSSLGEPTETVENDSSITEVYFISDNGYMAFEYCNPFPNNVCSIQITGRVPDMEPFLGLKLGDSEERIYEVLGLPSKVENVTESKVQVLAYTQRNGSVEIDEHGRLLSIHIKITNDMFASPETIGDPWTEFVSALRASDRAEILNALRPDVEIYRDGDILSIEKKYSDFRNSPERVFMHALLGQGKSVLAHANVETPEAALRKTEKMGVGLVYKFKSGEILDEVVFFPFNGRLRIYEIVFKPKNHGLPLAVQPMDDSAKPPKDSAVPFPGDKPSVQFIEKKEAIQIFQFSLDDWNQNAILAAQIGRKSDKEMEATITAHQVADFESYMLLYKYSPNQLFPNGAATMVLPMYLESKAKPSSIQLSLMHFSNVPACTDLISGSLIIDIEKEMTPEFHVMSNFKKNESGCVFTFFITEN